VVRQPLMGQGLRIVEASQSHSDTPQSVGLPWTRALPDYVQHTKKDKTSTPPPGFEPTLPADKRPQNHTLDRAATGIGFHYDPVL